jgi:hypothetical protein
MGGKIKMASKKVKKIVSLSTGVILATIPAVNAFAAEGDVINTANKKIYKLSEATPEIIKAYINDVLNSNIGNEEEAEDNFLIEGKDDKYYSPTKMAQERTDAFLNVLQEDNINPKDSEALDEYLNNQENLVRVATAISQVEEEVRQDGEPQDTTDYEEVKQEISINANIEKAENGFLTISGTVIKPYGMELTSLQKQVTAVIRDAQDNEIMQLGQVEMNENCNFVFGPFDFRGNNGDFKLDICALEVKKEVPFNYTFDFVEDALISKIETKVDDANNIYIEFADDAEVTAESLADTSISLTNGETVLTAAFNSFTEATEKDPATAVYALAENESMEDAAVYTVTSNNLRVASDTFQARIESEYAAAFEAVTKKLAIYTEKDWDDWDLVDDRIYFSAKNQYDEDIEINEHTVADISLSIKLNGMPLVTNHGNYNDYIYNIGNNYIDLNERCEYHKGDILTINIKNKYDVASQFELTIEEQDKDLEIISNPELIADKTTIKYGDSLNLTFKAVNQFNNPARLAHYTRWTFDDEVLKGINDDKLCIDASLIKQITDDQPDSILGTHTIKAYYTEDSSVNASIEITIERADLAGLYISPSIPAPSENWYNHEEIILGTITPNDTALLTPEMLQFEKYKVEGSASIEEGEEAPPQTDKIVVSAEVNEEGNIVIKAVTTEPGLYRVKPFVENEDGTKIYAEENGEISVETTINPTITSFEFTEAIGENDLTEGRTISRKVEFRNEHSDLLNVPSASLNITVEKDSNPSEKLTIAKVEGEPEKVTVLEFTAKNPIDSGLSAGEYSGEYTVTITVPNGSPDNTFVNSFTVNVAPAAVISSVELGEIITDEIIAGDENAIVYKHISFINNYDNEVIPTADELAEFSGNAEWTLEGDDTEVSQVPDISFAYYKTDAENDGYIYNDQYSSDVEGVAFVINAEDCTNNVDRNINVTVTDKNNITDSTIATVKAIRQLQTLTVEPEYTSISLNGESKLTITSTDQYGEFIEIDPSSITIEGTNVELKENSAKAIPDEGPTSAYEVTVIGTKVVSDNVLVKVGEISSNPIAIEVKTTADTVASVKLTNNNLDNNGNYKYLVRASKKGSINKITFGLKTYNSEGDHVTIAPSDIIWISNNHDIATVENGIVTINKKIEGKVTITVDVFGVKSSVILNVSKETPTCQDGTVVLENADIIDADENADGIQISLDGDTTDTEMEDGTIALTFCGLDQYGDEIGINGVSEAAVSGNKNIITADYNANTDELLITPHTVGTADVRFVAGSQTIILNVDVTLENAVIAEKVQEAVNAIEELPDVDDIVSSEPTEDQILYSEVDTSSAEEAVAAAVELGATAGDGENYDINITKLNIVKAKVAECEQEALNAKLNLELNAAIVEAVQAVEDLPDAGDIVVSEPTEGQIIYSEVDTSSAEEAIATAVDLGTTAGDGEDYDINTTKLNAVKAKVSECEQEALNTELNEAIVDVVQAIEDLPAAGDIVVSEPTEGQIIYLEVDTSSAEEAVAAAEELGATAGDGEDFDIDTTKLTNVKNRIAELQQ